MVSPADLETFRNFELNTLRMQVSQTNNKLQQKGSNVNPWKSDSATVGPRAGSGKRAYAKAFPSNRSHLSCSSARGSRKVKCRNRCTDTIKSATTQRKHNVRSVKALPSSLDRQLSSSSIVQRLYNPSARGARISGTGQKDRVSNGSWVNGIDPKTLQRNSSQLLTREDPSHRRRGRVRSGYRQYLEQINSENLYKYAVNNSDCLKTIAERRAEIRREKSRLAAQIRRNRESQNLMLLQNALPISTEVLGSRGLPVPSSDPSLSSIDLLSLFRDDQQETDVKHLLPTKHLSNGNRAFFSSDFLSTLNETGASSLSVNLEKSDILRITGYTLFLLDHIYPHLGTSASPALSLDSRSLYGLLVDLEDMHIVYVTPALAEALDWAWVDLIGASVHDIVKTGNSVLNLLTLAGYDESNEVCANTHMGRSEPDTGLGNAMPDSFQFIFLRRRFRFPVIYTSSPSSSDLPEDLELPCFPSLTRTSRNRNPRCGMGKKCTRPVAPGEYSPYFCPSPDVPILRSERKDNFIGGSPVDNSAAELAFYCWRTFTINPPPTLEMVASPAYRCGGPHSSHPSPDSISGLAPPSVKTEPTYADSCSSDEECKHASQRTVQPTGSNGCSSSSSSISNSNRSVKPLQIYLLQPLTSDQFTSWPTEALDSVIVDSELKPPMGVDKSGLIAVKPTHDKNREHLKKHSKKRGGHRVMNHREENRVLLDDTPGRKQPLSSLVSELTPPIFDSPAPFPTGDTSVGSHSAVPNDSNSVLQKSFIGLDSLLNVGIVSESLKSLLNITKDEEILGRSFLEFVHLDDLGRIAEIMFSVIDQSTGFAWSPVYRLDVSKPNTKSTKSYRWVRTLIRSGSKEFALMCWHQNAGCEMCNEQGASLSNSPADLMSPSAYQSWDRISTVNVDNKITPPLSPLSRSPVVAHSPLAKKLSQPRPLRLVYISPGSSWPIDHASYTERVPLRVFDPVPGVVCPRAAAPSHLGEQHRRTSKRTPKETNYTLVRSGQRLRNNHLSSPAPFPGPMASPPYYYPLRIVQRPDANPPRYMVNDRLHLAPTKVHTKLTPILFKRTTVGLPPSSSYHSRTVESWQSEDRWSSLLDATLSESSHGSSTSNCPSPAELNFTECPTRNTETMEVSTSMMMLSPFHSPTVDELAHAGLDDGDYYTCSEDGGGQSICCDLPISCASMYEENHTMMANIPLSNEVQLDLKLCDLS
ncbi:unnamed protein product [Calicophoron daubneyi]|uniref:PAS domain-containing protein n=1 Tax=Calicophoron daubneyi TaxID=300641 RepID=A0AAV2TV51_CALDB